MKGLIGNSTKSIIQNYTLTHCSSFNNPFSSSDYIALDERIMVDSKLERMWKEAAMA
jgi:hypothetical protein